MFNVEAGQEFGPSLFRQRKQSFEFNEGSADGIYVDKSYCDTVLYCDFKVEFEVKIN
jgi:hypothetical protein